MPGKQNNVKITSSFEVLPVLFCLFFLYENPCSEIFLDMPWHAKCYWKIPWLSSIFRVLLTSRALYISMNSDAWTLKNSYVYPKPYSSSQQANTFVLQCSKWCKWITILKNIESFTEPKLTLGVGETVTGSVRWESVAAMVVTPWVWSSNISGFSPNWARSLLTKTKYNSVKKG